MPARGGDSAANIDASMTVKEFIRALGGPTVVGTQLGVRPQAVSHWCSANRAPMDRVPALLRMARDSGVPASAWQLCPDVDWSAVCGCVEASA